MTDGRRPHRMPQTAIESGDELLGWQCGACARWIREYGPIDRSECPVDWRHNDGWVCSTCDALYDTEATLKRHVFERHNDGTGSAL